MIERFFHIMTNMFLNRSLTVQTIFFAHTKTALNNANDAG
jgi:hypothetical protein